MGLIETILGLLFGTQKDGARRPSEKQREDWREEPPEEQLAERPARRLNVPSGNYQARDPVEIRYLNFQDVERTFTAEKYSIRPKGKFISVCVEPTGSRITLKKANIQNPDAVQPVLDLFKNVPAGDDLRVLKYHQKRGTTSDLNEQLKAKYPDWVKYSEMLS